MPLSPQWRYRLERWRESLAALFRSDKPQEARPKLCPSCGTLVGASATKCHECGASMTLSLAAASRSLSQLIGLESPVTYIILAANFLLFAVSMAASLQGADHFSLFGSVRGDVLMRLGALHSRLVRQGEIWRLVTPIFLHGGLLHIGMNMMVLKDVGPELEELYGSPRFLFFYVTTGVAGFLLSVFWKDYLLGGVALSVGASGSLLGLIGLMLAITSKRGGAYMREIRARLIRSVILIFGVGLFFGLPIDNAAHAGGLLCGFLLGKVAADREPMNSTERNRAYALGWIGALVIVGSFATMMARYFAAR